MTASRIELDQAYDPLVCYGTVAMHTRDRRSIRLIGPWIKGEAEFRENDVEVWDGIVQDQLERSGISMQRASTVLDYKPKER